MPIQRYDQYSTSTAKLANKNGKIKSSSSPPAGGNGAKSSSGDEDESKNINEIRRLIREQTNLSKNSRLQNYYHHQNSGDSSDELEVPIRKFTPLPDIPRMDDAYFRTESNLVAKRGSHHTNHLDLDSEYSFIDDSKPDYAMASVDPSSSSSSSTTVGACVTAAASNGLGRASFNSKQSRMETRYHFGNSSNHAGGGFGSKKPFNHRLPSLEKTINHTIQNTMDLDEDLPMNPEPDRTNQRQIYTSPGDRIISPIKRPNAPSPVSELYSPISATRS